MNIKSGCIFDFHCVGTCKIVEMPKCEGEAVANNRKAKLIFFYEWVIELKWQGEPDDSDEPIEGKVEIPNLSEEHDPSDVDVTVTVLSKGDKAEALKELMRSKGTQIIRERLETYIAALKQEFSQGMILPTRSDSINQVKSTGKTAVNYKQTPLNGSSGDKAPSLVKVDTTSIMQVESFKCTAEEVYRALTVKEMVQAFSQSPCVLEVQKGGRFELFGGNVSGTFLELVPDKKIRMRWRFGSWPQSHYSDVTINIEQKSDCTEVTLTQEGVPQGEADRTRDGWQRHYWDSMKRTFGFGAILF
ncbi:activator of 90 kDa heat shock protein ATPase homolog 1 isoform X2 [Dermacentor andersoni]|uniref:activator of 90 kDa heat shock protein ATPase homolog 1 isoform X2 n=1 Tax=Dermacentor andersoni TaxID=34620 RepID=UPI0024166841|nr:activator of 90 kDa heat shock protein ATPase homolog 1-like isoform X2 [Dermacentor andersoni]